MQDKSNHLHIYSENNNDNDLFTDFSDEKFIEGTPLIKHSGIIVRKMRKSNELIYFLPDINNQVSESFFLSQLTKNQIKWFLYLKIMNNL